MNDVEAWQIYKDYRWVYNKLELYQRLGYTVFPHGIDPVIFPTISKPITNLWGMGIGVERWISSKDINYKAGYLWMEEFYGPWVSWDINFKTGDVYIADANCENVWEARPDSWLITKSSLLSISSIVLKQIIALGLDKLEKINIETIGDYIIEVHLRWSNEFEPYYDKAPFYVHINWQYPDGSFSKPKPNRTSIFDKQKYPVHIYNDEPSSVLTKEGKPVRLSYQVQPIEEAQYV